MSLPVSTKPSICWAYQALSLHGAHTALWAADSPAPWLTQPPSPPSDPLDTSSIWLPQGLCTGTYLLLASVCPDNHTAGVLRGSNRSSAEETSLKTQSKISTLSPAWGCLSPSHTFVLALISYIFPSSFLSLSSREEGLCPYLSKAVCSEQLLESIVLSRYSVAA